MGNISLTPLEKVIQTHVLTSSQILCPSRKEKEILQSMDEDTYEELVASWAFSCLKTQYEDAFRIGGAGDKGIDVIAYRSVHKREFDIYQCKHYKDPIPLNVVLAEICKILYFIFVEELSIPQNYFFSAPKGISPHVLKVYNKPESLRGLIKEKWEIYSSKIIKNTRIPLSEEMSLFIDKFDFSKFSFISPDKFIELLRQDKHLFFQYFGFRKTDISRIELHTPPEVKTEENNYILNLLAAYNEKDQHSHAITSENVSESKYASHFKRARDTFWKAESIRKISEDNSPGETDEFEELMEDMFFHIADTYEEDYCNGLERNKKVLQEASHFMPKQDRIISGEISTPEKQGVCYHLSNRNQLKWVK